MRNKKLTKKDKEKVTLAVIIASVLICLICIGSDLIDIAPKVVKDELGGLISDVGDAVNATEGVIGQIEQSEGLSEDELGILTLDTVEIVRVVDGDTYILNINGEDTRVRLIGVDTPESVAPDNYHKENTDEGRLVSEIVKEKMAAIEFLYIEYDVGRTDKYGRTLAYLYFPDGTMVQDWLLENGYADAAAYAPNTKYAEHFGSIVAARNQGQQAARRNLQPLFQECDTMSQNQGQQAA